MFPFAGVVVSLLLGVSLTKLVIDETADPALIAKFYQAMTTAPSWFVMLNLLVLLLGTVSNAMVRLFLSSFLPFFLSSFHWSHMLYILLVCLCRDFWRF
jgi:ABC-type proline/glycine betaine transport system permease subunit